MKSQPTQYLAFFSRGMQRECDVEVLQKKMNFQKQEKGRGVGSAIYVTRELPGVALVNISTRQIFMGKGNILNYIDILK